MIDSNNAITTTAWVFADDGTPERDDAAGEDAEKATDEATDAEAISIAILETNAPVGGGETLTVTAELENNSATTLTQDVQFVVGEEPTVVDRQTVTISAGATAQVTLSFETYPVAHDDTFPVRVVASESAATQHVTVYGTERDR